ncbi:MAG: prepilin-type N-terminal cleavage/methylation domain-containing protein, partial [Candidatus Hydrogenedentes bacterium]|nr:prepilin-type N-terminal cleavage/methylation domain-containing protein [Candidatus Hydrogenedentota bacterium]
MRQGGFTLLEILVAVFILAVIVGIVYATFATVANTVTAARVSAEELRLRQFLLRSFETNLGSVYADRAFEAEVYR